MKNKIIIITGAAMGLGLAAAKELASKGAKLALVDYNEESLENAKQELGRQFPAATLIMVAVRRTLRLRRRNTPSGIPQSAWAYP